MIKKRLGNISCQPYIKHILFFLAMLCSICWGELFSGMLLKNNSGSAYAEKSALFEAKDKISIDEYYKKGTYMHDPELPDNLKWMPFSGRGVDEKTTEITPVYGDTIPLNWDETGSFSNELCNGKYGSQIKQILSDHGINIEKLNHLFNMVGKEKCVSFYDSGHMVIFDDKVKKSYIIQTKPGIALALEKVEFELVPHGK
jgi:hypothetical protein